MTDRPSILAPLLPTSKRDHRLDFWRGLCLIDMVVVHLVQYGMRFGALGHEFFADYTRFAAGGYVLISGMTVGFVFLPRAIDPNRRAAAYKSLLRRAAYILIIHYAVTVLEILIILPLHGDPLPPMGGIIWSMLLFRQGYELLPFYVFMLAVCPLVLELIRRRLTWVVAIVSAGLFAWGSYGENYKRFCFEITHTFFFVLWQAMFVIGLFAGTHLRAYSRLSIRTKLLTAAGCWAMSVVLFFAAYGDHFNLLLPTPLTFLKNPLSFGEMLRYLGLIGIVVTTTDLLWKWIDLTPIASFVNSLGRRSLAMYIAQIYVVGQIDRLGDYANWPWGTQPIFMAIAVLLLWWIAYALDWFSYWRTVARLPQPASQTGRIPLPSQPV